MRCMPLAPFAKDDGGDAGGSGPTSNAVHVDTVMGSDGAKRQRKKKRRGVTILPMVDLAVAKDFDPTEARDDHGEWTSGGAIAYSDPIPTIAPHYADPIPTKSGRGGRHNDPTATKFTTLSPQFQTKILKQVFKFWPDDSIDATPHTAAAVTKFIADNLDKVWASAQSDSTAMAALNWYSDAHNFVAALPGDIVRNVGVVTALSPRVDWDSDKVMGKFILAHMNDVHGTQIERAKALADLSKAAHLTSGLFNGDGKPRDATVPTYDNMLKAVRIYDGESPDHVLAGHKVRSFFDNIIDPSDTGQHDDVTIDRHAMSAAVLHRVGDRSDAYKKMFIGTSNTSENVEGAYALFADAFRLAAQRHGLRASQYQAVLWTHWQTIDGKVRHRGMREDFPVTKVAAAAGTTRAGMVWLDPSGGPDEPDPEFFDGERLAKDFDPTEARDDKGEWTSGGGGDFWHGSPNGQLGSKIAAYGLHVGTYQAAKEALEARIGKRADGKDWDGTQEYGKTLIASTGAGYGVGSDGIDYSKPHYPNGRATYSDGTTKIPMDAKPDLFPVKIVGKMTNTPHTPHEDFKANGLMAGQIKRGRAKSGYFYTETGEDAGSIAAVVPSAPHLERLPMPTRAQAVPPRYAPIPPAAPQSPPTSTPNPPPISDSRTRTTALIKAAVANGGFTWHPSTGTIPTTGYMVALQGDSLYVPFPSANEKSRSALRQAILTYIDTHDAEFKANPNLHLGGWWDKAHGEFTLDRAERITDREKAITLGKQRNQQSIYDLAGNEEIDTGGTGDREKQVNKAGRPWPTSRRSERTRGVGGAVLGRLGGRRGGLRLLPVAKANPNHDALGRFASAPSSGGTLITDNVNTAATALGQGRDVELRQPREVATLLDKLRTITADAKAKGDAAPNYNLCEVSVEGTNLFCAKNLGVPRIDMPQLSGKPVPGSAADKLPRNEEGEVDVTGQYLQHLRDNGVAVTFENEAASHLRATQDQLVGAKVAGIAKAIENHQMHKNTILVSADNYIVDGHHRWAAYVDVDLINNKLGEVNIPVARIDLPITKILPDADAFAAKIGIEANSGTGAGAPEDATTIAANTLNAMPPWGPAKRTKEPGESSWRVPSERWADTFAASSPQARTLVDAIAHDVGGNNWQGRRGRAESILNDKTNPAKFPDAKALLDAVANGGPLNKPLYRGMALAPSVATIMRDYPVGKTIEGAFFSFSTDPKVAEHAADEQTEVNTPTKVIFTLPRALHHLNLEPLANLFEWEHENLVGGKFKVTAVSSDAATSTVRISLSHEGAYDSGRNLHKGHDVSGEARDDQGRWTSGGGGGNLPDEQAVNLGSPKGWSPEVVSTIHNTVVQLTERFPAVNVRSLVEVKGTGVHGRSNTVTGEMGFSRAVGRGRYDPPASFGTATQSLEGLVTHEFGHHVLETLYNERGFDSSVLNDTLRMGMPNISYADIKAWRGPALFDALERQTGGSYANKDSGEAFAEAFANGLGPNPSPVGKEVVEMAEAWLGRSVHDVDHLLSGQAPKPQLLPAAPTEAQMMMVPPSTTTLNATIKAMKTLRAEYPEVSKKLQWSWVHGKDFMGRTTPSDNGIKIELNLNDFAADGKIESNFRDGQRGGFYPPGKMDVVDFTIAHEFGHAVIDSIPPDVGKQLEVAATALLKRTAAEEGLPYDLRHGYASVSLDELLAVEFAEYKLSPEPRPIAVKIGKLIDVTYKYGLEARQGRLFLSHSIDWLATKEPPANGHRYISPVPVPLAVKAAFKDDINELTAQYPGVVSSHTLRGIVLANLPEGVYAETVVPHPEAHPDLFADPDETADLKARAGTIGLNRNEWGDPFELATTFSEDGRSHYHVPMKSLGSKPAWKNVLAYNAHHEFAHSIFMSLPEAVQEEGMHTMMRVVDHAMHPEHGPGYVFPEESMSVDSRIIRKNLSYYASTSPEEFVAEAWTEKHLAAHPRPFAVQVGGWLDDAYAKKYGTPPNTPAPFSPKLIPVATRKPRKPRKVATPS